MKNSKLPSTFSGVSKKLYLVLVVLALALTLLMPRILVADPRYPESVYFIPSVLSEEDQIKQEIRKQFRDKRPEVAIALFTSESNLKRKAHGDKNNKLAPKGSHCFAQINVSEHQDKIDGRDIYDIRVCADVARKVFDEREKMDGDGYNAWSDYKNGNYKRFMP